MRYLLFRKDFIELHCLNLVLKHQYFNNVTHCFYFLLTITAQLLRSTSIRKPEHSPRSFISSPGLNFKGSVIAGNVQIMEEMSLPVTREMLNILLSAGLTEAIVPDTSRILLIYFAEAVVSLTSNSFCSTVALKMKSGLALAISVCFRLNIYRAARIPDKAINETTNNAIFT